MSNRDYFAHQLFTLIPFALAQIGIIFTFLSWSKRRFSARGAAVAWFCALGVGLFQLITVMMDMFPWFWPAVRPFAPHFSWMRTVTYVWMYPSTVAFIVLLITQFGASRSSIATSPSRRRLLYSATAAAVATPFIAEGFGVFIGRLDFKTREVDLHVPNLHPDLNGLRILQLSDVHLGAYLSKKEFARVVDASNELRANVALMTGDLISTWGDPIDDCLAELKRVRSDAAMLGCLGNHELYTDSEEYVRRRGAALGMRFLRNETQQLRFGNAALNFAGIDYLPFKMRGHYLTGAAAMKSDHALNILLSHNPDVFPEAVAQGWDVTLSGHTHGGQVTLEIFDQTINPARVYTRYVSGLYQRDGRVGYVTRGIGTIGIPARLGATPEITLLRLRRA